MRKVDEKLIDAIRDGRNAAFDNTTVMHSDGDVSVYLHGHMIAQRVDGVWRMSLAGYNTNTTRNRLTAIMQAFCGTGRRPCGVKTTRGKVFMHDARGESLIDATGWHVVYGLGA